MDYTFDSSNREGLELGASAGVAATLGASLLYRGLAIGRMGLVAPITPVLTAAIPLSFGLGLGERPDRFLSSVLRSVSSQSR